MEKTSEEFNKYYRTDDDLQWRERIEKNWCNLIKELSCYPEGYEKLFRILHAIHFANKQAPHNYSFIKEKHSELEKLLSDKSIELNIFDDLLQICWFSRLKREQLERLGCQFQSNEFKLYFGMRELIDKPETISDVQIESKG